MALLCAAALPIAFAMPRISINASGSTPMQSCASHNHDVRTRDSNCA
jgi:hypothetical protein